MKLRLIRVDNKVSDVKEFVFEPTEPFTWTAGQYMHYVLPHPDEDDRGIERWFTNSAAPSENEVRITTRVNADPSSSFKQALQKLQPGDAIEADGPEGDFVLQDPSRNYIFVAGGIGITPIRSILVEARSQGLKLNATILYANRNQDIPFRDDLERLQADDPGLTVRYIIDPEHLDEATLSEAINTSDNPLIYISGPEPMVKSLAETVKSLDVDEANIQLDDFPGYERI